MSSTTLDALVPDVEAGRKRFLALVADIRPELHRYCARLTGSVTEGEDIVQDTLARAYYALPEIETLPSLRAWLFTIAHHRALDYLRRYDRRMGEPLDDDASPPDLGEGPEDQLAHAEASRAAIARFLELPVLPRSCVILKDVLGHSVDEIAALLEQPVPTVKAALHRGRQRLRVAAVPTAEAMAPASPIVARWATLFNARDWDGVRALLADDVRLDLVSRSRRSGKRDVSGYVANYERFSDWHLAPARLDGREVVAGYRSPTDARPSYFVELTIVDGLVTAIRDFRYVPYICVDAAIET